MHLDALGSCRLISKLVPGQPMAPCVPPQDQTSGDIMSEPLTECVACFCSCMPQRKRTPRK